MPSAQRLCYSLLQWAILGQVRWVSCRFRFPSGTVVWAAIGCGICPFGGYGFGEEHIFAIVPRGKWSYVKAKGRGAGLVTLQQLPAESHSRVFEAARPQLIIYR